ncbi:alpha/beta fold hydrolase [Nonomuraea sp. NPDC049269]|uniref:alpha/beta fold hydrolase n=1 Tax=Nonomuraea sp. NPDC049269 TaxID=3364349 RepID=UPI0037193AC0
MLVAGAWHGPWAWDRVVPLLEGAGARTIVPDLAYGRDVGLHDHVAQVVAALDAAGTGTGTGTGTGPGTDTDPETRRDVGVREAHHDADFRGARYDADIRENRYVADAHAGGGVVLVGHSYAGLVVRQAADLHPERVDHVIMVEGWAGADGDSLFSLAPEGFVKFVQDSAELTGQGASARTSAGSSSDGWQVPAPAPALFGITDSDDTQWLQERLRPQPLRTFTEGTRLTGAVDQIPGTAIYCRPQTFAFDRFAEAVGYRTVALDGPHDVMLTDPGAVADVLMSARFRNRKLEA